MSDHQEGVVLNDKPELSTRFYDILRRSSYVLPVNELIKLTIYRDSSLAIAMISIQNQTIKMYQSKRVGDVLSNKHKLCTCILYFKLRTL